MHILLVCVFLPKVGKGTREVTQTTQFILDDLRKISVLRYLLSEDRYLL